MSAVLRLYPRAWRDRYGDELVAFLDEHPPALGDRLDLIRGALDAHLHPQVRGSGADPAKETLVNRRIFALMAAIGGVLWIGGIVAWLTGPLDADGYHDATVLIVATAIAMVLMGTAIGELGTRPGDDRSRLVGHAIAATTILGVPLILLGWPLLVVPIMGFPILAAIAATRAARNDQVPAWIAFAIIVGAVAAFFGFGGSIPDEIKWASTFFGATFILFAAWALGVGRRPAEPAVA